MHAIKPADGGYRTTTQGLEVARLLIKYRADVNQIAERCWSYANGLPLTSETPLFYASTRSVEKDIIELLLINNADLHYQDAGGMNALMHASNARDDSTVAVDTLLNNGAIKDINKTDTQGMTALMWASRQNHARTAQLLLKNDANVNLQDNEGNTALIWVAKTYTYQDRFLEISKILIQAGADPNIKNNYGKTAADYAKEHGCPDYTEKLDHILITEFVYEKAKEEGLSQNESQEIIEELKTEEAIKRNITKLNEYYDNQEFSTDELAQVLNGKTPTKDTDGKINFHEPNDKKIAVEIETQNSFDETFTTIVSEKQFKKDQIKEEWHELVASSGEILISFVPVVGPPISVAFSQLVTGNYDGEKLFKGLAWGGADLVGVGCVKKIKNIEKVASIASKIAAKVKIAIKAEGHHAFPKFMGGNIEQTLVKMSKYQHIEFHKDLIQFLKSKYPEMITKPGYSGRMMQRDIPPELRIQAMREFYSGPGAKYAEAATEFFKQI